MLSKDDKNKIANLKFAFVHTNSMDIANDAQNGALNVLFVAFASGEINGEEYNDHYLEVTEWAIPNPQLN